MWRFVVKAGLQPEFEDLYGPEGAWAAFFRGSPAYHGTRLLRGLDQDRAYLLMDFWDSEKDFEAYKAAHAAAYGALDHEGEAFTEAEEHRGWFDVLD